MERKLTAILSADVAGYSRLMGEDEEATICTLTAYRAVISTAIQQHRGRVVDSPGDNLLAEFASVVDAVRCAVEIQRELNGRNTELPEPRRMAFRIGLNLGDVVMEGERIYGDGVNIAARLESLADPGGICIAGTVYDQVENKLSLTYEYLGEQTVKNIAKPVRVYRVAEPGVAPQLVKTNQKKQPAYKQKAALAVVLVLLVGIGGVGIRYLFYPSSSSPVVAPSDQASALPLPDKPSIVVLPFANMSGDPEQDYFSDGLTEELTSTLSQLSRLFVISRTSAFTYRGKAVKVQDVGRELGVRYVLEGSVRRVGSRVRITTQLIEAATGYHLWAERYDRELYEIFALQEEIVQKIAATLNLQLTLHEQGILVRKRTDNLEAYDSFLRGVSAYCLHATPEANLQARAMFEKATTLDPTYAEAYAWLGMTYIRGRLQYMEGLKFSGRAFELAQKALALDASLPEAHQLLSYAYLQEKGVPGPAIAAGQRAIALAPNDADCYAVLADILLLARVVKGAPAGGAEAALELLKQATRLNPRYQRAYALTLGNLYLDKGQYQDAIVAFEQSLSHTPVNAHLGLALAYLKLGRAEAARAEAAAVLRLKPDFNLEGLQAPYTDLEEFVQALRRLP